MLVLDGMILFSVPGDLKEVAKSMGHIYQPKLYVWQDRILYFGTLEQVPMHRYGAAILFVGLDDNFQIRLNGGPWRTERCGILPANVAHEISAPIGVLGKLFVENTSPLFRSFKRKFSLIDSPKFFFDEGAIANMRELYFGNCGAESAKAYIDKMLEHDPNLIQPIAGEGIDSRIQAVLENVNSSYEEFLPEPAVAEEIGLSASRFRHLFKAETGISYRHYRTWRRLINAARHIHTYDSLTHAAHTAGYSDLSHFSNQYRQAFGVKPSFVYRDLNDFYVAD